MVTDAQNLANLGTATRLSLNALNLYSARSSDWSQAERIAFVQRLAQTILTYPAEFNAGTIYTANAVLGQNFGAMQFDEYYSTGPDGSPSLLKSFVDTGFDAALDMGADVAVVGRGAVKLLASVGRVAENVGQAGEQASATAGGGWLLPAAVIAVVALLTLTAAKEVRRAVS